MEKTSVLHSSCLFYPSMVSSISQLVTAATFPARTSSQYHTSVALASFIRFNCHIFDWQRRHQNAFCNATAVEEPVGASGRKMKYIEVGDLTCVHGVMGEIGVKPQTDFPELRFCKPGKRWLRQKLNFREIIREVELVDGREYPPKKIWVVKFSGYDSIDLAKQLLGSTMLISEDDRPPLAEGEFYSYDLLDMQVILEDSGELVGSVIRVFTSGPHDVLEIIPDRSFGIKIGMKKPGASKRTAYLPFISLVIPFIDVNGRKMRISPPEGLLEFYFLPQKKAELDSLKMEKIQMRKFKRKLLDAKRKLYRMEQKHIFGGFKFGDSAEQMGLANDIVRMNLKLLQLVLKDIVKPSKRCYMSEFLTANSARLMGRRLRMSVVSLTSFADGDSADPNFMFVQNARHLTSSGKTSLVLIVNDFKRHEGMVSTLDSSESAAAKPFCFSPIDDLLSNIGSFPKLEDRASLPLVVVCSAEDVERIEENFSANNHFSFDSDKVWFIQEEKMPVISHLIKGKRMHKILMESPWKMLQFPSGSGGVISLLSSFGLPEYLEEIGVEYIEVYSLRRECLERRQMLLGFASYRGADFGIQISEGEDGYEENIGMVFSMRFMKELTERSTPTKLHVDVTSEMHSHVELVYDEWKDVAPSDPNSYALSYSIYSALNCCSLDKVCLLEITK